MKRLHHSRTLLAAIPPAGLAPAASQRGGGSVMGRRARAIVAVAAVGVASLVGGSARAAAGTQAALLGRDGWGAAIEVPGIAALDRGGYAAITSVSCGSAGNCSAGGYYGYHPGSSSTQAFVVSEVHGTWHRAIEVPGTAALNQGVEAETRSVSCASAGNCSAGGSYLDSSQREQAFVVSEVHGTWHRAIEVPGVALNQGGGAGVASVSCASPGNCSAGGSYLGSSQREQAFVVSEVHGTWHRAVEVLGIAAQGGAAITSVSCASAGDCGAGGYYFDSTTGQQAFVVGQAGGTWHKAVEVPGTAALNQDGQAGITSVSCASAGHCSAGGYYFDGSDRVQVFVASQAGGTWRTAIEVPGTGALNQGGDDYLATVSCGAAGNCSAGGFYTRRSLNYQAFVARQVGGTWHRAIEVRGTAALNQGETTELNSVSCASAGNCSAGGTYAGSSNKVQAFVASQIDGTWRRAIAVPGTAALNQGGQAEVTSVSCASAGHCSAGGTYTNSSFVIQAFLVSQR